MTKTEDRFAIISGRLRGARELHKLSAHETAIRAGVSDEEYNSFSFLIRKLIDKKVKCLMLLENWICMIEILSCRKR